LQAAREKLTQLVFEHNNVAGFVLYDEALLSLYSVGRLSGCVIDFGHNKIGTP
jgi:actin-related protein 7